LRKFIILFISLFLALATVGCQGERGESVVGPSGDRGATGSPGVSGGRGAEGPPGQAPANCPAGQHRVADTCTNI